MRRVNPFILSTVSLAALAATPAFAQAGQTQSDQAPPSTLTTEQAVKSGQPTPGCDVPAGTALPPSCTPAVGGEGITVTGTRIRSPNLESPLPVTSVGGQEFFQTGNVSVGDKLAELPQIASTFTQANSTRFLGTAGLNLLDLRGLGTARTLVLVNGRRHVGGDVLSTGVSVDVNTIPTDLIDRVDVVTGGNSAVYGSDAVAGVVNFVLKDHFDGFQLRAQGGESKYGDANSYFISGLYGNNFADGRGNIAVNVEYARRDQAWGDERKFEHDSLVTVDADLPPCGTSASDVPGVTCAVGGSDGNPDNILIHDFHSVTFSNTGTILFGPAGTFGCGVATGNINPTPYNCPYIFQPNGDLVPVTGQRVGIGPNGAFIGGNGEDFVSGHQLQITPQLDRYNINVIGHFEASPAFVPFVEATLSKTKSVGTGGNGPAFIAGTALGDIFGFLGGVNREQISINNPFLSDQARTTICDIRAQRGQTCPDTLRFTVNESLLGLGNRVEDATRSTFRIVGGVRGDIGSNWNYEFSVNYGALHEKTKIEGNLNTQRMLLAMDAVKDPATGQIVCRSQIDPSAAFGGNTYAYNYLYGSAAPHPDPNFQQRLQQDIAACVPVNVLGGNFTDAQKAYLLEDTTAVGRTKQFDVTGFISGDSSKWFSLPGGPAGIVLGAEYRSDNLFYHQNQDVTLGYTFYNSIPTFQAPASNVKEAFGEIRLPLLKDLPLVHELEVSGAARVSNYNLGSTGTVWAWNANVIYSPIQDLRLRGNYAKAVRAPNQVELFSPFGQNFSLVTDPCDADAIGTGSANRQANCIAAGVPAGTHLVYSDSLPFLSGGNKALSAEVSKSITVGGVFTPRFLPGFSASVDYFDIKVKKAIQFLSAQFILDQCVDLASLDNPFCGFFQRATGGQLGHDQLPNAIIDNSLQVTPFNFAQLRTRGLDMEFAYRHRLGNIGRLDTKVNWTHALQFTQNIDPSHPKFEDALLQELPNPKDAFNWNTSLQHGRFTVGYQMRYIGKMLTSAFEDFNSFPAGCTDAGCPPFNTDVNSKKFYAAKFYHDVRFGVDVGPKFNFYMGVDNLTNTTPPYALSGIGAGSAIYDNIGRFYYAGIVAKFQ
jgi:outer membrane receptor protein involved in Fe transport